MGEVEPPRKRARCTRSGGPVLVTAVHGARGRRPTMEDTEVSIPDLHQFAVSAVLDSSATNPYSPNTVDGSLRKMAAGFLRLARVATSPTPPLMTLHGLFDGHGGRQAAEFCKQ
eukprot:Sspe_Gene.57539::Locus_31570_Transcript_4_8_Confidence_0.667_Length_690::g.57539::m.57539